MGAFLVDAAGRAQLQSRQRAGQALEHRQAAHGGGREQLAYAESARHQGHELAGRGAARDHRDRRLRQRVGQGWRGAGGDQEVGTQFDAALHLFGIEHGAHAHGDVRQFLLQCHQRVQRRRRAQGQFDRAQTAAQQGCRQPARLVDAVRGDHRQDAGALQQLFGLGLGIGDGHGARLRKTVKENIPDSSRRAIGRFLSCGHCPGQGTPCRADC